MSAPKARSPKPPPTPYQPWRPPLPLLIIVIGLPVIAGLMFCWTESVPGSQVLMGLISIGLSVICGGIILVTGIVCVVRRTLVPAVIIGAVVLVGLVIVAESGLPLKARFTLHRAQFDAVAAQRQPSDEGAWRGPCPTRIGTYPISRCVAIGSGYLYYEPEGGLLNGAGFAYLPDGPDRAQRADVNNPELDGPGPIRYEHLSGSWYSFIDPW